MTSPSREHERALRISLLTLMQHFTKKGMVDHVQDMGKASAALKTRIETHDYTREDLHEAWLQARMDFLDGKGKHPGTFEDYLLITHRPHSLT